MRSQEHKKIIGGLHSLVGRVWIDGRRVRGPCESSVKLRLIDESVLPGRTTAPVTRGNAESGGSFS